MSTNRHISTFQILSRHCHKSLRDNNIVDAQITGWAVWQSRWSEYASGVIEFCQVSFRNVEIGSYCRSLLLIATIPMEFVSMKDTLIHFCYFSDYLQYNVGKWQYTCSGSGCINYRLYDYDLIFVWLSMILLAIWFFFYYCMDCYLIPIVSYLIFYLIVIWNWMLSNC